jgi:hypothetical protein
VGKPLKLFADYRQIHIHDAAHPGDLSDAWTAQATDDRIATADGVLGIGTQEADDVSVDVQILDDAPGAAKGDHVTESSLRVKGKAIAVLGCTDYLPDAKQFAVSPGTYRMRATHTIGKTEKIRIELWPAKQAKPKVLVQYDPEATKPKAAAKAKPDAKPGSKPEAKKAARPKNHKQAVAAALRGETDVALEVLLELHTAGDAAASASAAEILAFQGKWDELVPCAKGLLARPTAVYAGNVAMDMKALLARGPKLPPTPTPSPPDRARFDGALADPALVKRFKGKPKELAQHLFALAWTFHLDDEIIARWDPSHPYMHFDSAMYVARAHVRRNEPDKAWAILEERLPRWYPVDNAQVLPVVLLTDGWVAPLMTPERAQIVLRTPRAVR